MMIKNRLKKRHRLIFLLLLSFIARAQQENTDIKTNTQRAVYMQEQDLTPNMPKVVSDFWETGYFSHFFAFDDIRINYAQFIHDQYSECLVIVPGRSETYLKYQELSYDLFQQGYNIFLLDHRGQGLSERLVNNHHKGYVDNFSDYVNDLDNFIETVVTKSCNSRPYLLAHSMGGAIATRYMQQKPEKIKAAVLSSPMLGFNSGPVPTFIAKTLILATDTINRIVSDEPWYFVGQKNYQTTPFSENKLSHSTIRYQHFVQLYKEKPEVQLGGVTVHWLSEGIKAQQKIFSQLVQLTTPISVLQAGEDSIIDNQAQDEFCLQLNMKQPQSCVDGKPVIIKGAYHELFIESDAMRQQALEEILRWFKQHH